ncbi:MAG: efflux transporter outer membrane subunit [Proteobacteria bacterium]|nr:efflux transporter outer membrane subunit [Pseudomonadota bacterium]
MRAIVRLGWWQERRRLRGAIGGLCALHGLGGCILNVDKIDLGLPLPPAYRIARNDPQIALPKLDWWRGFRSTELTSVIEAALTYNHDIAIAIARIVQADAQARIAGAPLLPLINLSADAQRTRSSANAGGGGGGGRDRALFGTAVNASYEIDFWGKNRASLLAAQQFAVASRFDHEVVALTTVVAASNSYFQVLAALDRLRIARENVAAASRILALIRQRVDAGTASSLDVAQQESLLATQRAAVPPLEIALRQTIATLAVLVGVAPEQFDVRGGSLNRLVIPRVTPGLPSNLLLHRPDLRSAEAQLASANANVTAARAAFFPTIALTGETGLQSSALGTLFTAASWQYAVAAGLAQPIFRGGQLVGQLQLQEGRREELVQTYRQAIISAFADVERALVALQQETRREGLQAEVVRTARRAFEIAETRLREGTIDLITVLNTQQTLFQAQDTLVQVRLARFNAVLALFQALGGGWPPPIGGKRAA